MSTVLTRFSLLGAAVGLVLAGCGTGPSQAGSAVIVGDTAIPLEQVQQRLNVVLKKEPAAQQHLDQGKLDIVSRLIVTSEVEHQLVKIAAQREGITVDETKVSEAIASMGGEEAASQQSVQDASNIRDFHRDVLLKIELANKYMNRLEVTIDFFFAKDGKEAVAKARQVAEDPAKMDEFVREAPKNPEGAQLSEADKKVRTWETPSLAPTPIFGVPAGTVVAFSPNQAQAQWMVALVKERRTDGKAANSASADGADPKVMSDFGARIVQALTADVPIRINPRYGVWDPAVIGAVPGKEKERAGFIAPVRSPKQ